MQAAGETAADPRWPRIVARDGTADGAFWYVVATTGVYCRPSCPSRTANPANVTIHPTLAEARATGARACLRCRPDENGDTADARVLRAARTIAAAEVAPPLTVLARAAGLSAGHFQRVFKATVGLSPKRYAAACRDERLRAGLAAGDTVTRAMHAAGFGSSSRLHAAAGAALGMAPVRYRRGGMAETLRFTVAPCPLGHVLVASSGAGVAAILLGDDAHALERNLRARFPAATLVTGDALHAAHVAAVVALVETPGSGHALPLDIRGTAFQQRVWRALTEIPPGRTASYTEVAAAIGAPSAVRAVAGACAANAHAIAIPCHRVVRGDGGLSGYRWGPGRKRALLDREAGG